MTHFLPKRQALSLAAALLQNTACRLLYWPQLESKQGAMPASDKKEFAISTDLPLEAINHCRYISIWVFALLNTSRDGQQGQIDVQRVFVPKY